MHFYKGVTPTDSFGEVIGFYFVILQFASFVPSFFVVMYEGMAYNVDSIFNKKYGKWDELVLPG